MTIPNTGEDAEEDNMAQALSKAIWQFLIKLTMQLANSPEIALSIYPRKIKTYVRVKIFTKMLITVLFIIAKK